MEGFQRYFGEMTDPRIERSKLYPLEEILFVVLCGSICGAESWRDFVSFGEEKLDFLREYFPFKSGIPCKNTFARACSVLDPEKFRECFIAWTRSLQIIWTAKANDILQKVIRANLRLSSKQNAALH